jgi:selenocysteine lyase/cysteine desulfurase
LFRKLWNGLAENQRVRLYGPPPDAPRTPTLAFTVHGMDARAVATKLAESGVFVSHGDFYALSVLERLGLLETGLVRAGCACYTTDAEINRLIAGVAGLFAR